MRCWMGFHNSGKWVTGNSGWQFLMCARHWSGPWAAPVELTVVCMWVLQCGKCCQTTTAPSPFLTALSLPPPAPFPALSLPLPAPFPVYILERERKTNTDAGCQAVLAACWAALCCCCLLDSLDWVTKTQFSRSRCCFRCWNKQLVLHKFNFFFLWKKNLICRL